MDTPESVLPHAVDYLRIFFVGMIPSLIYNIGSGVLAWLSAMLPQTGQASLGMLMTLMGLLILLCWLPLASRFAHHEPAV